MTAHHFIADPSVSISRGLPLSEETGLGELTLSGFLRQVTERYADREALVEYDSGGHAVRWSYAELWERSADVAKALIAHGLGKGERVGILMTNRAEFLSATFGTALAGGVAATLSTFSTPAELEHLVASSACSILLIERHVLRKDFARMLIGIEPAIYTASPGALVSDRFPFLRHIAAIEGEAIGAVRGWADFLASGAEIPIERVTAHAATVTPADPGVLFFSSGSTGKPKGILSAHRGVTLQMWRMGPQQGLDDGVRTWTANGFFWSGNFAMAVGATLASGGSLILQRIFQPAEAIDLMEREKASFLFAWPHQWAQLQEAPNWQAADLSAMRHVDTESPLTAQPTIHTQWIEPRHCYGNTETFTLSTAYPANTSREVGGASHGVPLPGNILKIVDPLTGTAMPLGERGELAIKGPTLMLGYIGIPLDESLDEDGYFRTGDGGYLDANGRLFWEGRLNDIIKTGGANVSPIEIDDVLRTCPGVKIAQTVGVPDDLLGELVVSCIVPQDDAKLDEAAVQGFAKQWLASYKVPRRVLFFTQDDLSMTGSAKIKTADLRALASRSLATTA
ncbi:AMP-binding protein [Sphingobium sufflavum]|uniref:class I adenylate-forming enzyme family protein n=1 Tax=Sphingobium sufflavum TaxID=1129547 RepID=UPI001F2A703A|nr:AMP-binding protein [Sphingobium sufflavum]MCE7798409.1 AMP-binding protein [Sphingobium sufflavum]